MYHSPENGSNVVAIKPNLGEPTLKSSSKNTTSQISPKPPPTVKGATFFRTRTLTPSEIESLRQNGKEVSAQASAFFKQKIKDKPQD
jgi:hypothetical protein